MIIKLLQKYFFSCNYIKWLIWPATAGKTRKLMWETNQTLL